MDADRTPDAADNTERPAVARRAPAPRSGARAASEPTRAAAVNRPETAPAAGEGARAGRAEAGRGDEPTRADEQRTQDVEPEPQPTVRTPAPAAAPESTQVRSRPPRPATPEPRLADARTREVPVPEARGIAARGTGTRGTEVRGTDIRGTGAPATGMAEPTVPTNIYRARRPAVAIFLVIPAVAVGLLLIRALAISAFGKEFVVSGVLASSLGLAALPLLVAGLYGLITGAAYGAEQFGFKVWARPPLAYLVVGLTLVLAAGLAIR